MGAISQIPQGLLSLLQIKEMGRNPDSLAETVQPQVDLGQLWLNRLIVDITTLLTGATVTSVNVPTAGAGTYQFTPLTVPNNQTWWIESMTVQCTLLAAENIRMNPGFVNISGSCPHTLGTGDFNDIVTARVRQARMTAHNFWLLPGSIPLVCVYDSLTAGNISVGCGLRGAILLV
ncbi:MAG TPA: hypothetical protein VF772_26200 [Terriglobales bacterium]